MTDYDVQRIARAVVQLLNEDDRFAKRMEKFIPKRQSRMLNSNKAAELLGVSQDTLRDIAPYIGGIKKGSDQRSKWTFVEEGLRDRYIEYLQSKQ